MTTTPSPVIQVEQGHSSYFASSRTTPGAWWRIVVDHKARTIRCSCPAGLQFAEEESDRSCAHTRAAVAWQIAQDRRNARPTMPANVSALVD